MFIKKKKSDINSSSTPSTEFWRMECVSVRLDFPSSCDALGMRAQPSRITPRIHLLVLVYFEQGLTFGKITMMSAGAGASEAVSMASPHGMLSTDLLSRVGAFADIWDRMRVSEMVAAVIVRRAGSE